MMCPWYTQARAELWISSWDPPGTSKCPLQRLPGQCAPQQQTCRGCARRWTVEWGCARVCFVVDQCSALVWVTAHTSRCPWSPDLPAVKSWRAALSMWSVIVLTRALVDMPGQCALSICPQERGTSSQNGVRWTCWSLTLWIPVAWCQVFPLQPLGFAGKGNPSALSPVLHLLVDSRGHGCCKCGCKTAGDAAVAGDVRLPWAMCLLPFMREWLHRLP